MRILVVGAGPAGLYFSYLAKRRHPDWQIRVVEQNRADSTFGFGVVFSDRALEFLRGDDAATYDLITPQMEAWSDITVVHRGTPVVIDGIGFAAIGRLKLLRLLQAQLASVGIAAEYEKSISDEENGYDLVVAADGVNSTVRGWRDFGTTVSHLENKFAWYGTTKVFDTLTQTFVENEHGTFNAHHYRHSSEMSTFVVECDAANLGTSRLCFHGRGRNTGLLRKSVRRLRAPSGVEPIGVAELSQPAQPTLVGRATSC